VCEGVLRVCISAVSSALISPEDSTQDIHKRDHPSLPTQPRESQVVPHWGPVGRSIKATVSSIRSRSLTSSQAGSALGDSYFSFTMA
jgi:hypothetical protein